MSHKGEKDDQDGMLQWAKPLAIILSGWSFFTSCRGCYCTLEKQRISGDAGNCINHMWWKCLYHDFYWWFVSCMFKWFCQLSHLLWFMCRSSFHPGRNWYKVCLYFYIYFFFLYMSISIFYVYFYVSKWQLLATQGFAGQPKPPAWTIRWLLDTSEIDDFERISR